MRNLKFAIQNLKNHFLILIACLLITGCSTTDRIGSPREISPNDRGKEWHPDTVHENALPDPVQYKSIHFRVYPIDPLSYAPKTGVVQNYTGGTIITMVQWVGQINTKYKTLIDGLKLTDELQDVADAKERTANVERVTAGTMTLREKDLRLQQMADADKLRASEIANAENKRLAELSTAYKSNTSEGEIVTYPETYLEGDITVNGLPPVHKKLGMESYDINVMMKVGELATLKFTTTDNTRPYLLIISGIAEEVLGGSGSTSYQVK